MKGFCTAITCMDGRTHLPVIKYLRRHFSAEYVDLITEAGPNAILSAQSNVSLVESILARIHTSVSEHDSVGIAVVGHHDCAGNPVSKAEQLAQVKDSVNFLRPYYQKLELIGLWVDENWELSEVKTD